jgi:hypothetical protein
MDPSKTVELENEAISDEIADLEEYARNGQRPPRCRGFRIRVNRDLFVNGRVLHTSTSPATEPVMIRLPSPLSAAAKTLWRCIGSFPVGEGVAGAGAAEGAGAAGAPEGAGAAGDPG